MSTELEDSLARLVERQREVIHKLEEKLMPASMASERIRMTPGKAERHTSDMIALVLGDPSASYWLKDALQEALRRDPVDASRDADLLAQILEARVKEITGGN